MAITLRGNKGAPLTHDELDQNFRQFYYSSSFKGSSTNPYALSFFTSRSADFEQVVNLPTAVGEHYNIQIKSGSDNISSSFFTSSNNFQYNFASNHLSVSGSGEFEGDLIVSGTLTANQFETVTVSSSILFSSGSTINGNTLDDTHRFTGSIFQNGGQFQSNGKIQGTNFTASNGYTGSFNGTVNADNGVISSSAQLADDISGSLSNDAIGALNAGIISSSTQVTTGSGLLSSSLQIGNDISGSSNQLSSSFSTRVTTNETGIESLTIVTGSYAVTASNAFTGSQVISGSLVVTGSTNINGILALPDIANVSASIASAVAGTGIQNVVEDTTPQLGGDLDLAGNNISGAGNVVLDGDVTLTGSAHFSGSFTASGDMFVDGLISASGDIIAFATSDERLKDNVTPIASALDKINQIGGYEFDWNSDSEHSGHDVGVIAQEIEAVLPEVVAQRKNGFLAVRYEKIVALLIQAIKEQQLQIDELKSKL